ncbi:SIS domain-containing protein [Enterococcus gallinarum]|uniref:SIS domain-containing protein n=1 Tax=Enterococcus gallinarum TaxID=1353 RepID=UPI002DBDCE20|nr:SIS domain-containing protein [Enterococcus gallinarum]MEB6038786.1 SIS domain-containing protein [Enterococcus gallinarum]
MASIQEYLQETPSKLLEIIEKGDRLFSSIKKEKITRIFLTGSGTSYHSALQMAPQMQKLLQLEVRAVYPFTITEETFLSDNEQTLVVGISQGGSSFSTYNAMKLAKSKGCITASMAGEEQAFIDEMADFVLTVHCGPEKAGAKTKGFYCTKLNLLLLALYLGLEQGTISEETFEQQIQGVKTAAGQFQAVYETSLKWISANQERLVTAKEIRVTGPAAIYGDVLESALKLLETMRCPVSGYEFEEFIHGIYNAINEDSMVFILDNGYEPRSEKMKEVLSEWSDTIFLITTYESDAADLVLPVTTDPKFMTFNFIVLLQLICGEIPHLRGVDPSTPKDPQFHMKLGSKKFNR